MAKSKANFTALFYRQKNIVQPPLHEMVGMNLDLYCEKDIKIRFIIFCIWALRGNGASINYIDEEGGGGVTQMLTT